MEPKNFVVGKPSGGVNSRTYPTELQNEEFVMLKNVDPFQYLGAFVTRKGTEAWNSTLAAASVPIRAGYRFYYGDPISTIASDLLVTAGNKLFKKTGAAGNFTQLEENSIYLKDTSFAAYLSRCYIQGEFGSMRRWDGTTLVEAGFPIAPASAPNVATGAAGVLTGDYRYKITKVYDSNTAHESSGTSATSVVSPSSQKVELTAIATGTIGHCTARNIYRTTAGGSTYYFLATISNNTTTTYSDNTADASLDTSITVPEDNGVPPAGRYMVFWRGRLVVSGGTASTLSRIFLSAITSTEASPDGGLTTHGADIEIFPSSHYIDVGDDNRPITGLAVVNDQLVIFKEDQIWNLTGDEASDMRLWKAQAAVGCNAPKTIVNIRGIILFLGRNEGAPGVYSYDGSSADGLSQHIEPYLIASIKDLGDVASQAVQPCATHYRGCYILSYPKVGGTTFELAILDTRPPRPRWLFADGIEASIFIPFNGPGDDGEMYYGHATEARVLRLDSKLTNYDATTPTAIAMTIETGWMDLDAPYHLKTINWIDIYGKEGDQPSGGDPDPGDTTITIERRYDFASSGTTLDCAAVNVSTASKHMSRSLWKHRIHPEGSEGTTPEICYRMKLVITSSAPIEIHRIVINYTPSVPEDTHGQN